MKYYIWFVTMLAALTVGLVGCSKKTGVDTTKLQKSFQSADTATQSSVNKAIVSIQSEDYAAATTELQKLAAQPKLTPEQQQAIKDTLEQLKKMVGEEAKKAMGDVQKALPK